MQPDKIHSLVDRLRRAGLLKSAYFQNAIGITRDELKESVSLDGTLFEILNRKYLESRLQTPPGYDPRFPSFESYISWLLHETIK